MGLPGFSNNERDNYLSLAAHANGLTDRFQACCPSRSALPVPEVRKPSNLMRMQNGTALICSFTFDLYNARNRPRKLLLRSQW